MKLESRSGRNMFKNKFFLLSFLIIAVSAYVLFSKGAHGEKFKNSVPDENNFESIQEKIYLNNSEMDIIGDIVDAKICTEGIDELLDNYGDNIYKLLNIGNKKLELGFNNLSEDEVGKFDTNERAWIDLDEDYKWFSDVDMKFYLDKDVAVDIDEYGKIQKIIPYDKGNKQYPYNGNSPANNSVSTEMSLEITAASRGIDNCILFKSYDGESLGGDIIRAGKETKYYEYEYDSEYVKNNMSEWEELWNRDFEKVKGLKDSSIEDINAEDNSVYLVSRNKDYIAKNVVKIKPSKKEVSKIVFRLEKIIKDYSGLREMDKELNIVDIDGKYNISSYADIQEADGWFLMNEKNSNEYFVIRNSDTKTLSYENVRKIGEIDEILERNNGHITDTEVWKADDDKFEAIGTIESVCRDEQFFVSDLGKRQWTMHLTNDKPFDEWFPNWSTQKAPVVYKFEVNNPQDDYRSDLNRLHEDWEKFNVLQDVRAIVSLDKPITYRFLGILDNEYVFGYGGQLDSEYFDVEHSFRVSEEDMTASYYLEKFKAIWNNKVGNKPYYYQGKMDDSGNIEFMRRFNKISSPYEDVGAWSYKSKKSMDLVDKSKHERTYDLHMAENSLTGKTLLGEYIDENIEIVEVMKLQDEKDEIILKIKRENGKIAEIVSESDSWLGYEIGQKLFVRMRLKDENPVAICWVMGND